MPKINDLTTRPGGPQPTDEIWLASAGGAADFKSNFNAILTFIANNTAGINVPVVQWVPAVTAATTNATFTGLVAAGRYIKLGPLVFMEIRLDWATRTGGAGRLQVSFPAGLGQPLSGALPATFMRNVTMPANSVGRPSLAAAGALYYQNGAGEGAFAITGLGAAGGVLAFQGVYINY